MDYYADDAFLQRTVRAIAKEEWSDVDRRARDFSKKVSFRWRELTEVAARPENHPSLRHYDGHGHRIDRIVRPLETIELERELFAEGYLAKRTSPLERAVLSHLLNQNGESGVVCPLICTEGLVAVLDRFADREELHQIRTHLTEGIDGECGVGAQFLSEIQGGSDVPTNCVAAHRDGDAWRLYGQKFFCSATQADYAVVTAKPVGSDEVGMFVVPSWLPGDKQRERRNGYTIDRLKWKMGTCELPTAEVTFDGARAYQLGPLDRGIANVVGIVLTISRLALGLCASGYMARAAREAKGYARFRRAFGQTLDSFPMVQAQLDTLERMRRQTTAGAFRLHGDYFGRPGGLDAGSPREDPLMDRRKRFVVRELIMLQKAGVAADTTQAMHTALTIFGGHGVMEDFSCFPRLYREAAVNELWEGPRNVLLSQLHRDMQSACEWFPPREIAATILDGTDESTVSSWGDELEGLVAHRSLLSPGEETVALCQDWDDFCQRFLHAWQEQSLASLEAATAG